MLLTNGGIHHGQDSGWHLNERDTAHCCSYCDVETSVCKSVETREGYKLIYLEVLVVLQY